MQVTEFQMRKPDDFHVHLREGTMLETVLPYTARRFKRALVMPNLKHPVDNGSSARVYENQIRHLALKIDGADGFRPLLTIKMTQRTDPSLVKAAHSSQVFAAKLYPEGVTTNSSDGVNDIEKLFDTFKAMQECGMVLCIHGEQPGAESLLREQQYLPIISRICANFPKLKIVLEHVTTCGAIEFVASASDYVGATITVHHLLITLDDIIGDKLNPHNFCKPIAKSRKDREALVEAATGKKSFSRKFFLGTDSAPHDITTKECAHGCAGCFTAPMAVELLATIFEKAGALPALESFASERGARFYNLPLNEEVVTLNRVAWTVPARYGTVVPFMAGETIPWSLPFTQGEVGANS